MAPSAHPESPEEKVVAWSLTGTWWLWLCGGLYVLGPVLGWWLGWRAARAYYLAPMLPPGERPLTPSPTIAAWIVGMTALLPILVIGHLNFDLGAGAIIKSAVGWAKGWALLALFPVAGYVLPIRLAFLARTVNRLGRQSLMWLPLFLLAPFVHLPQTLWVSPLKMLGGSDDSFFSAILYTKDPETGGSRWQFFAPWAPAVGMVAIGYILVARFDPIRVWRWTGFGAAIILALLSQSRMAIIALAVIVPIAELVGVLDRKRTWLAIACLVLAVGLFEPQIAGLIDQALLNFKGARADSSRVRATLGRIAVQRWQSEAYWFGHGIVERGPHIVEYMKIGSHHSWYGLLYVKGLLGMLGLALPMTVGLVEAALASLRNAAGRGALTIMLVLWLYSFGENLEVLSYITWPALTGLGICLREARRQPAEASS